MSERDIRKRAVQKANTPKTEQFRKQAVQIVSSLEQRASRASSSEREQFRKRAVKKANTSE
jgi:hypothetical protein